MQTEEAPDKKEEVIELDGEVIEALPNAMFRVKLDNEHEVIAYAAGKMRKVLMTAAVGDRVQVQIASESPGRGRILR